MSKFYYSFSILDFKFYYSFSILDCEFYYSFFILNCEFYYSFSHLECKSYYFLFLSSCKFFPPLFLLEASSHICMIFIAIQSNIIFESSLKLFHIDYDSFSQDFIHNGVESFSFVTNFSLC